jgi:hypothetical protein
LHRTANIQNLYIRFGLESIAYTIKTSMRRIGLGEVLLICNFYQVEWKINLNEVVAELLNSKRSIGDTKEAKEPL